MYNWSELLDPFSGRLLQRLGEDPEFLPTTYNAVTRALKLPTFVQQIGNMDGFSRRALARAATICQMQIYDARGGPDEDHQPKGLRRHWYSWFKSDFAQPFALQLGDFKVNAQGVAEIDDTKWAALLSTTYAHFVDNEGVTYQDLWVGDTSRRKKRFWEELFRGCFILVAVEKDSLFEDFFTAASAMGARAVYSGKGKSSKAGIEDLLRKHFGWSEHYSPFTEENPLYVLVVSDWDFDGEAVIDPTFAEQARRYTPHVLGARVGVNPRHVSDAGYAWQDKWYQVKLMHSGYRTWAQEKALFLVTCQTCGRTLEVQGSIQLPHCPFCEAEGRHPKVGKDTAHGLEVEALVTRQYYGLMVDALLRLMPFDFLVAHLRDECVADAEAAAKSVRKGVLDSNADYRRLQEEFRRLNRIKSDFEETLLKLLVELAKPHIHDWRDEGADPSPEDFRRYVAQATGKHTNPWRPFDPADRTRNLVAWLLEQKEVIEEYAAKVIEF